MSLLRRHSLAGELHPFYRAILIRALELGYVLPSVTCQRLQNKMVKDLVGAGIWARLRILYVLLNDSTDIDFCRIDWITPSRAVATGSPTFVSKGGVGNGYLSVAWNLAEHTPAGFTFQNGGWYCYVKTGAANTANVSLFSITAANTRRLRLLSRTTPRQDIYWCVTDASPHAIQSGNLPSNTSYAVNQVSTTLKAYINGVDTGTPVGGNLEPDTGPLDMGSGQTNHFTGCVAIHLSLDATQVILLDTIFRTNYALVL